MADLVWARDRDTNKVGQFEESFLAAWPLQYHRLSEPPKTKSRASAATSVPEGTDKERGA
jgi:hypothetical protein